MIRQWHIIKTLTRFRVKGLVRDVSVLAGIDSVLRSARGYRILVYHGICQNRPFRFNTLFTRLAEFEIQLRLYKKYFNIISLDDLYSHRFRNDRFNISLTFDDGFANNYKYVLPLLEKYEVPASFFITGIRETGADILWNDVLAIAGRNGPSRVRFSFGEFVKGRDNKYISTQDGASLGNQLRRLPYEMKLEMMTACNGYKLKVNEDYWMQMTEEQIKDMAACKWVTIGSHSAVHNDLAACNDEAALKDMKMSRQYLERITGQKVNAIAFPYGSFTAATARQAHQAGYTQLLGADHIPPEAQEDTTIRNRLTINPFITGVNQLYASIRGKY